MCVLFLKSGMCVLFLSSGHQYIMYIADLHEDSRLVWFCCHTQFLFIFFTWEKLNASVFTITATAVLKGSCLISNIVVFSPFFSCYNFLFQAEAVGTCARAVIIAGLLFFPLPTLRQLKHVRSSQQPLTCHPTVNESRMADVMWSIQPFVSAGP